MSIYATIGENEPAFFASLQGWKELTYWADDLDAEAFGDVVHVAEHGFTNDIQSLATQLTAALVANPPSNDVRATIGELLEVMSGESGELIVNSGFET